MNKILMMLVLALTAFAGASARPARVSWTVEAEQTGPKEGLIRWTARIDPSWHIYGMTLPDYGDTPMPTATTFDVADCDGLEFVGPVTASAEAVMHFDEALQLKLPWYEGTVEFVRHYTFGGKAPARLSGTINYMACTSAACTAPAHEPFSVELSAAGSGADVQSAQPTANRDESAAVRGKPAREVEPYWWSPSKPARRPINGVLFGICMAGFVVLSTIVAMLTPGVRATVRKARAGGGGGGRRVAGIAVLLMGVYLLLGFGLYKAARYAAAPAHTVAIGGEYAEFDDYDQGMAYAAQAHRPVAVYFTRTRCADCERMDSAVMEAPEVRRALEQDYVLIRLVTDDRTPVAAPYTVQVDGKKTQIDNCGQRWAYLERHKFDMSQVPMVALLDDDGRPLLSKPILYTDNPAAFADLLDEGVDNYTE